MLLFLTVALFSQKNVSYRFLYKITLKKIQTDSSSLTEKQKRYNRIVNKSKGKDYILDIKENKSIFYEDKKLSSVSNEKLDIVSIFVGKGLFYYDSSIKIALNKKNVLGEDLIIRSNPKFSWTLTQESRKIGNYQCYKAISYINITNRIGKNVRKKIIAWYNPLISINFGIKNYHGLPGLTMLLEEDNLIYEIQKINLNTKIEFDIKKPTKGKILSEKEYNDILLKKYRQRF